MRLGVAEFFRRLAWRHTLHLMTKPMKDVVNKKTGVPLSVKGLRRE